MILASLTPNPVLKSFLVGEGAKGLEALTPSLTPPPPIPPNKGLGGGLGGGGELRSPGPPPQTFIDWPTLPW